MSKPTNTFTFSSYIDPQNGAKVALKKSVTLVQDVSSNSSTLVYKTSAQDTSDEIDILQDYCLSFPKADPPLKSSFDSLFPFPNNTNPQTMVYITKDAADALIAQVSQYTIDDSTCPSQSLFVSRIRRWIARLISVPLISLIGLLSLKKVLIKNCKRIQ